MFEWIIFNFNIQRLSKNVNDYLMFFRLKHIWKTFTKYLMCLLLNISISKEYVLWTLLHWSGRYVQDSVNRHQTRKTKTIEIFSFVICIVRQVIKYYWSFHLENAKKNSFNWYMFVFCDKIFNFFIKNVNVFFFCLFFIILVFAVWACSRLYS